MLCILKRLKNGFWNSKLYSTYTWDEKQNTVKKRACSSFFQKYINCPNITRCLPKKYFSPEFRGGQLPPSTPCLLRLCQQLQIFFLHDIHHNLNSQILQQNASYVPFWATTNI